MDNELGNDLGNGLDNQLDPETAAKRTADLHIARVDQEMMDKSEPEKCEDDGPTDFDLRLHCLDMAIRSGRPSDSAKDLVRRSKVFYEYLTATVLTIAPGDELNA